MEQNSGWEEAIRQTPQSRPITGGYQTSSPMTPQEMAEVGYRPNPSVNPSPAYQTPGYQTSGYQTPGYQSQNYQPAEWRSQPGYQTPGYQTPGYQSGYQTPEYQPGYPPPEWRNQTQTQGQTQGQAQPPQYSQPPSYLLPPPLAEKRGDQIIGYRYPSGYLQTDPTRMVPISCPQMKLVAWSLLQLLVRIYDSMMAGPEQIRQIEGTRTQRFRYTIMANTKVVEGYVNGEPDATEMAERTLVSPLLEIMQQNFATYVHKLPIPQSTTQTPNFRTDLFQLHNFFSAVYYFYCPRIFAHNMTPLSVTTSLAEEYIKSTLATLFGMIPSFNGKVLAYDSLFNEISESIDIIRGFKIGAFIQDKFQTGVNTSPTGGSEYMKQSYIGNALLEVLRTAAKTCLYAQLSRLSFITTNPVIQAQIDSLQYSEVGEMR